MSLLHFNILFKWHEILNFDPLSPIVWNSFCFFNVFLRIFCYTRFSFLFVIFEKLNLWYVPFNFYFYIMNKRFKLSLFQLTRLDCISPDFSKCYRIRAWTGKQTKKTIRSSFGGQLLNRKLQVVWTYPVKKKDKDKIGRIMKP